MFKKILCISIASIVIASCSNQGKKAKTSDDSQINDSVMVAPADTGIGSSTDSSNTASNDTLKTFGTVLVKQKKECKAAFDSIKTSKDFLLAYHLLNKLEADMNVVYDKMGQPSEDISLEKMTSETMGNALPWISGDLVAEGTIPISSINNIELAKSAKLSPQPDDDAFVSLLIKTFGENGSINNGVPVWRTQNCDACYASQLGNGITYKVLQKADSIKSQYPLFAADVDSITSDFYSLTDHIFESPQENIIAEIDSISLKIKLTEEQKQALLNCRKAVSDTSKSHYQINCIEGDCKY